MADIRLAKFGGEFSSLYFFCKFSAGNFSAAIVAAEGTTLH